MDKTTVAGIYKITNFKNGKVYIGSSKNIHNRKLSHMHCLKTGRGNPMFQREFLDYGTDVFIFEILETCNVEDLSYKEDYYIKHYNSCNKDKGYNIQRMSRRTYYNPYGRNNNHNRKMIELSKEALKIYNDWPAMERSKNICDSIMLYYEKFGENHPETKNILLKKRIEQLEKRIERLETEK